MRTRERRDSLEDDELPEAKQPSIQLDGEAVNKQKVIPSETPDILSREQEKHLEDTFQEIDGSSGNRQSNDQELSVHLV